jgi:hypothetical protein
MKPTMTVGELIAKLNQYPADRKVYATWEGVLAPIMADNFDNNRWDDPYYGTVDALVIDVESY